MHILLHFLFIFDTFFNLDFHKNSMYEPLNVSQRTEKPATQPS